MTATGAEIAVTRGRRFEYEAVAAIELLVSGTDGWAGPIAEAFADGQCWVARRGGEIAGYALLKPTFFRRWWIERLIVRPDHRRQGVGTALVRGCEAACAAPQLFVSTNESNAPMRALLAKLAYEPSGRVDNLDENDPELIFVKRLGE